MRRCTGCGTSLRDHRSVRCRGCEGRRRAADPAQTTAKQQRLRAFVAANPFASQQAMAAFTGTSQEAVSRMLRRLAAKGLVQHDVGRERDWKVKGRA